jgi:MFS transporter, OFA family, oxalate/formate antiporter
MGMPIALGRIRDQLSLDNVFWEVLHMVCPFLGKNEDQCDVGCGYISSDDARVMVSFCHRRFTLCAKYQELAHRFPQQVAASLQRPKEPRREVAPPSDQVVKPLVKPFRVKWPLPFHVRFIATNNFAHTLPLKEESTMAKQTVKNLGWRVALAGTGINLALGVLYAWSIFRGEISESIARGGAFKWDPASVSDPYAVACLAFAFTMIIAGKCQDKFGPRLTAILGGLLVGSGFLLASQTTAYWGWIVGFGILAGAGMGFGYSAATPPALKWFPPAKTGLVAGIVVSGFGLAPVYIAPLAQSLLESVGLQTAMLIFGVAFVLIVCSLGMLVVNPPQGYIAGAPGTNKSSAPSKAPAVEVSPSKLFSDGRFYTLWFAYLIGAGAGLMVIGSVAGMAKESMGTMAFLAVAIMAVGNAAGRIVAGLVSDKIGRANTLLIMFVFQATMMLAAIPVMGGGTSAFVIVLLATFIGFNYGTNLCLFPAFTKDFWGLKNFGMNYGILFSAWGVGGFVLVRVAETLRAHSGSYTSSFAVAAVLLLVAAMLSLSLRPRKAIAPQEALAPVSAAEEELVPQKAK